jgi:hypothetical protein
MSSSIVSLSGTLYAGDWAKHRVFLDSTNAGNPIFTNNTSIAVYQFIPKRGYKDIVFFDWNAQLGLDNCLITVADAPSHLDSGSEPFTFYMSGNANYGVRVLPAVLQEAKNYDTITITVRVPPAALALGVSLPVNWNLELVLYECRQKHNSIVNSELMYPDATNQNSQANINSLSQTFRPTIPLFSPVIRRS